MAHISDSHYEALQRDHADLAALRSDLSDAIRFVESAAKCGFVNDNQEDALMFALTRLTKEPIPVIKLKLNVAIKGRK